MKLTNIKDSSFEMNVKSYESPDIINDEYDSNWLNINLKVKGLKKPWQVTDNCLLNWEILELIHWLEDIMINKENNKKIYFIEPNLRFVKTKKTIDNAYIRIYFELEARPKWAVSNVAGQDDLWIDLTPSQNELRNAIMDLKKQLRKYPIRGNKKFLKRFKI